MDKKRLIGLDFDDVLMDFRASLEQYYCEQYGVCLTRDESTNYSLWEKWGCTREESIQRVVEFYQTRHHAEAPAVPGVIEALKELSQNNSLVVITSRPDYVKEVTLNWLKKNFEMSLFDQVYFANLFASDKKKRLKSEICHELGVEVLVDDHYVYAKDVAESGKKVLLFHAPWNKDEIAHPNITRVYDWNHILKVLEV